MLVEPPLIDVWTQHVSERLSEAVGIGLLKRSAKFATAPKVFVPDGLPLAHIARANPRSTSLRILCNDAPGANDAGKWIERADLYDEAAAFLLGTAHQDEWLFCEAGYARAGDGILESRPHVMSNEGVFLCLNLTASQKEHVSQILRWSRSWRLLGVIAKWDSKSPFASAIAGAFVCDAFDGDSIAITRLVQEPFA